MYIIAKRIITNTIAKTGKKIETTDISMAESVSIVDTMGFPTPPVDVVEANLVTLEDPEIAAAVPPPAMMASDHDIIGLKSTIVDIITAVPANAASGMEILSNALSIKGI